MRQMILLVLICAALTACTTEDNIRPQPTATPEPFSAEVALTYPPDGAVIYAETITISGTVGEASRYAFDVEIVGEDSDILAESTVDTGGEWSVEVVHGYSGEPAGFTVRVVPPSGATNHYDSVDIIMAANSYRPEGVFGSITAPGEDAPIGGDALLIAGTISGTESFTVALVDADNDLLTEQNIAIVSSQLINEIPWEVEFALSEYTGTAEIRLIAQDDTLDTIPIVIGDAAG